MNYFLLLCFYSKNLELFDLQTAPFDFICLFYFLWPKIYTLYNALFQVLFQFFCFYFCLIFFFFFFFHVLHYQFFIVIFPKLSLIWLLVEFFFYLFFFYFEFLVFLVFLFALLFRFLFLIFLYLTEQCNPVFY